MKSLCILGVSGSIGQSTLSVLRQYRDCFCLKGVSVNTKTEILDELLKEFTSIEYVCVCQKDVNDLQFKYPSIRFFSKEKGLLELLEVYPYDMVVNALVGFSGLLPTITAIERDMKVALANKESIVVGGELIAKLLHDHPKAKLYPVDSEHVAIQKCLKGKQMADVSRLILTASGGAFRNRTREELQNVTVADALCHPSWSMGDKITIDSATMVNKAFEIIEAHFLFSIDPAKIDVLLHDESTIHSLIEMKDGSFVADIGPADMRIPIGYALFEETYQKIDTDKKFSLAELGSLHFRKLEKGRYPALDLAYEVLRFKGSLPCAFNAANEACNEAFRKGEIAFVQIEEIIARVVHGHRVIADPTKEDLVHVHQICYEEAMEWIRRKE